MSDREKMLLIAAFIERSESWQEAVEQKKVKVAQEVREARCKENTFHPRINKVSELMHFQKMNLLEQVNMAAAVVNKKNANMPL